QSSMPGPGIADRQSVAARVAGGDLEADQLDQRGIQHALLAQRLAKGREGFDDGRMVGESPRAGRAPGVALTLLANRANLRIELVHVKRSQMCHGSLLFLGPLTRAP